MGITERATKRELERLPAELAESGLAASALVMARLVDDEDSSTTSRSMCQGRLAEALRELRELAPQDEEADSLDELSARRSARLARGSGT